MTVDIREPRYYLVKHHLLKQIETLEPGEAIPTERELASELDTSRGSVRRAIVELVAEGRLVRRQGSGTYVAEPKLAWPLYLSSFTEQAAVHGLTTSSQLLAAGRISADQRTSERLGVSPGTPLFKIERLRCASGEPVALEASHLVASRFPQLTRHIRKGHSLYAVLARVYGVQLDLARQSIETAPASPREAALLAADSGAAMLILARQSFDQDGRPVEWVTSLYRGDRITFVANLTAPIAG